MFLSGIGFRNLHQMFPVGEWRLLKKGMERTWRKKDHGVKRIGSRDGRSEKMPTKYSLKVRAYLWEVSPQSIHV